MINRVYVTPRRFHWSVFVAIVEIKFHLECKLGFPCEQGIL